MRAIKTSAIAIIVPILVTLSNPQAVAADLKLNATYREMLEFKYRMQVSSVPAGSTQFEINDELLTSLLQHCVTQNSSMFDPLTRSSELAATTALERFKRKLNYVEARDPDDNSYFLGNPDDLRFNLCTTMILTGVSSLVDISTVKVPLSFLYQAVTMPDIDGVALSMLYRSFADSAELTPEMIEGFFSSLFTRKNIGWELVDSIGDDAFTSSSPFNDQLVKTYIRGLYNSPIFQKYNIYFSYQILNHVSSSQFDKKKRAEIVLSAVGHLNNTVLAQTVFSSFSSWDLSQEQVLAVYKRFGSLLSPSERNDAIQTVAASFKSVTPEIRQEILTLMASTTLTTEQKKSLLLTVLSDGDKYTKYGLPFISKLLTDDLAKPTRDEATFGWIVSMVRDAEINLEQKRRILNRLALDSHMTPEKIKDLLAYTEFYLFTTLLPADGVKTAVAKIIEVASKDERTRAFLARVVKNNPYTDLINTITWQLIKNYKFNESEVISLITAYYQNGSASSPQIINALVRKNPLTPYMGKVIASTPNQLAKLEAYKPILEFVMNDPATDEDTQGQIRYKLTGEIPTLKSIPGVNWDVKP